MWILDIFFRQNKMMSFPNFFTMINKWKVLPTEWCNQLRLMGHALVVRWGLPNRDKHFMSTPLRLFMKKKIILTQAPWVQVPNGESEYTSDSKEPTVPAFRRNAVRLLHFNSPDTKFSQNSHHNRIETDICQLLYSCTRWVGMVTDTHEGLSKFPMP